MSKFKSFLLYFVLPVTILVLIFIYGFKNDSTLPVVLQLKSVNKVVDLGVLNLSGGTLSKNIIIQNVSNNSVVIKHLYTDCNCLNINTVIGKKKNVFSLPKDLNSKPINILLPINLDFEMQLDFLPTVRHKRKLVGKIYIEPLKGQVLSIPVFAEVN